MLSGLDQVKQERGEELAEFMDGLLVNVRAAFQATDFVSSDTFRSVLAKSLTMYTNSRYNSQATVLVEDAMLPSKGIDVLILCVEGGWLFTANTHTMMAQLTFTEG